MILNSILYLSKAQDTWFFNDKMPLKGTTGLPLTRVMTKSGECYAVDYYMKCR